jgi:hypothetical protein
MAVPVAHDSCHPYQARDRQTTDLELVRVPREPVWRLADLLTGRGGRYGVSASAAWSGRPRSGQRRGVVLLLALLPHGKLTERDKAAK